jgi:N-acetylmuramoyl-L-alanine amidase
MPKVYISPSTQEANKGVYPFTSEELEMNKIADLLMPLLFKDGRFSVARNSPTMDIYQAAKESNDFKADIHIPIHSNAGGGGGEGTEVWAYGSNTNSERLAKCLYNQIAPLSPGADRGIKFNPKFVEVGDTVKATAALIELAFHDNARDAAWMAYNQPMIANGLYKGICDFYGYDYRALVATPALVPVDKNTQAIALLQQTINLLKA